MAHNEGNEAKPRRQRAKPEQVFGSTTWEWKRVKIGRPPEARSDSAPKGLHSWVRLPSWPLRRRPLTIKVTYRGGPEAFYEVHARGRIGRFSGGACFHDVMQAIAKHD